MSFLDFFGTYRSYVPPVVPEYTRAYEYIPTPVPTKQVWLETKTIRIKPFYYCSKPSTKRWKR